MKSRHSFIGPRNAQIISLNNALFYGGPQPPNSGFAWGFVHWGWVLFAFALGIQLFAFEFGSLTKSPWSCSTHPFLAFVRHTVSRCLSFRAILWFPPPPVPTYKVKNGLYIFGYCFPGPLLQCSLWTDDLLRGQIRDTCLYTKLRIWPVHLSIEASVAHHMKNRCIYLICSWVSQNLNASIDRVPTSLFNFHAIKYDISLKWSFSQKYLMSVSQLTTLNSD